MTKKSTLKIAYSAVCIALAMVLPFLTGQIPKVGNALSLIHIPVFLCGFLCGWPYGIVVGFISPILRFFAFGMPPLMPKGIAMAFELATYGFVSGILYKKLPKNTVNIYIALIIAMIAGKIVWGTARFTLAGISGTEFPFSAFIAGGVTTALPGIILHLIIIPFIVLALKKAKFVLNE